MKKIIISLFFYTLLSLPCFADSDDRYALVIGNSQYHHAAKLKNPLNDSSDVAEALTSLDFDVLLIQNATKLDIETASKQFLSNLAQSGGTGLLYYAGHGIQLNGDNYIVPIETNAESSISIKEQSYNVALLLDGLRNIDTATNIIILDACRDNPFIGNGDIKPQSESKGRALIKKKLPKIDTGLSKLDAPPNTLIAFSTAPGRIALDGVGRNSPYTSQLIQVINRKGLTMDQTFRQIRSDVVKQTNGQQVPWESSSLINDFYFNPRSSLPMGF